MLGLNFLDHRLKPRISTDAVCEDEYSIENLIAPIPREFIAYGPTKPPVSIDVKLVCPIFLGCVKIWAKVGSLKSTGFEISSETQVLGFGKCDTESGVYFYSNRSVPPKTANFTPILLKNCRKPLSHLRIVIRRTQSCAPVLQRLEIWGQPAKSCPEVENFASSSRQIDVVDEPPPKECTVAATTDDNIPEDFLDSLTFHIMAIPFTLPSGKVIDERTLERCNQEELEWGRSPSDPFTGLEYNRQRRPIFNSALKARIDHFLVSQPERVDIKEAPRTVGTYFNPPTVPTTMSKPIDLLPVGTSFDLQLKAAVDSVKSERSTDDRPSSSVGKVCQKCNLKDNLYQIVSCKHFICRNCLLASKELRAKCLITGCNTNFCRKDVVKYHHISR